MASSTHNALGSASADNLVMLYDIRRETSPAPLLLGDSTSTEKLLERIREENGRTSPCVPKSQTPDPDMEALLLSSPTRSVQTSTAYNFDISDQIFHRIVDSYKPPLPRMTQTVNLDAIGGSNRITPCQSKHDLGLRYP